MAKKDNLRKGRSSSSGSNSVGPPDLSSSDLMSSMLGENSPPLPESELLEEHEKLREQTEALQAEVDSLHETVESAIVPEPQEGVFYYKRFAITKTGLAFPEEDDVSQDEWLDVGMQLKKLDESLQWNLGDLCEYGRHVWGMTYAEMADVLDYEEQTLRTYMYVSENVDPLIRINTLSHAHHRLVASLRREDGSPDTQLQGEWLRRAAEHGWNLAQFRRQLKSALKSPDDPPTTPLIDPANRKRFNRVWRSLEVGKPIERDDIDHLERWLDEVKKRIG